MGTDESMDVVGRCFDSLREIISNLGEHFLTNDLLGEILDSVRIVMDGDAMCQISPDSDGLEDEDEEEEEEDDAFEHDSKLFGFVSDCLSELCKLLKERMGEYFDTYIKESLNKRSKATSSMDDKMYVAGVLCDFFNNSPIHMSK